MSIDISKLQVDSRDYISIYHDLMSAIPDVSQIWDTTDESDPGIVLVKLMSMYGDMLSYNLDRSILEVYPASVTQRRNAEQIFRLIGYKMRWYRSARCNAYLTNNYASPATLPKYTRFSTKDKKIYYTYIGDQTSIPSNIFNNGSQLKVELIQGYPYTPPYIKNTVVPVNNNEYWHSVYDYNVLATDVVLDNRIYLKDTNIDETSITLIDNTNEQWTQVDNLQVLMKAGKYYEFRVDDEGKPYIELCPYWRNLEDSSFSKVSKFKLFYIVSAGINGQIVANALTKITTKIVYAESGVQNQEDITADISITNEPSTYGYDPETPDEARAESAKYINTYDTLVTLADFDRAVRRLQGVANCIVTDRTCDPYGTELTSQDVKIYITRTPEYEEFTDGSYEDYIITSIRDNKLMPLRITVDLDSINYYTWNVGGTIYLKEKVSLEKAQDILVRLNNNLKYHYQPSNMEYNTLVSYLDLINTIKSTDELIYNVDLDNVEYSYQEIDKDTGDVVVTYNDIPKVEITGKHKYKVTIISEEDNKIDGIDGYLYGYYGYKNGTYEYHRGYSEVSLQDPNMASEWYNSMTDKQKAIADNIINGNKDSYATIARDSTDNEVIVYNTNNVPIKPGSIMIKLDNGRHMIVDNKNGQFSSASPILIENLSRVDYFKSTDSDSKDNTINIALTTHYDEFEISYTKNVLNMVKFAGIDIEKLNISDECIKSAY